MTPRMRIASAAAILAFLAVPVAYTAWSQDKADAATSNTIACLIS